MNDNLMTYLKENIDDDLSVQGFDAKKILPLFLSEYYDIYKAVLLGHECLFVRLFREDPGIEVLKKHIKVINEITDKHVILVYYSISQFRRKSLIMQNIPFIVENGQMYLPFVGLDLKKTTEITKKTKDKFSTTAQLIFLYFLYNKELVINTTEIATFLGMTTMSASRGLNELYSVGLLTYHVGGKTGRSKLYRRIEDSKYYKKGYPYLKSPVLKTVYIENMNKKYLIAGLEALSMITMLNPPKRDVKAIYKKELYKLNDYIINDRSKIADGKMTKIQIWSYNPKLIAKGKTVDIVSLEVSLDAINDERVEQVIEKMKKDKRWYMG